MNFMRVLRYIAFSFFIFLTMVVCQSQSFANIALSEVDTILQNREANTSASASGSVDVIEKNSIKETKGTTERYGNELSSDYVFVYFYRSTCSHCRRFSPILRQYTENTHIPVQAFTFDAASPVFPDSKLVNPQVVTEYFGGNTVAVPILFVMNKNNLHVYQVASGELSYAELEERMHELVPKILKIDTEQT